MPPRFRPHLFPLDDRCTPAALVVNALTDTGAGTGDAGDLRYCIAEANARTGADTITFDPAVFGSGATITLTSGTQLVFSDTTGSTTVTGPAAGVTVSGNNTTRVFQINTNVAVDLTRMTITGGRDSDRAGGIYNFGKLSLTDCKVNGNTAPRFGSGIFNHLSEASLGLNNCEVSGNSGSGGGIYNRYGTVNATDTTISGNGGLGIQNAGSVTLTNCTVAGNLAGGLFNNGLLNLTNCTVTGNVGTNAGGITNRYGIAILRNCTITDNTSGKGGVYNLGTTTLTNVVVAGNRNTSSTPTDLTGSNTFLGSNNLIGPGGSANFTNGKGGNIVLSAGDFVGLGTLGDYGGPVLTIPLLPGSPALNVGTPAGTPTTDARGKSRVGGVDIGAFERQGFTIAVAGGDDQITGVGTAFAAPQTVSLTPNSAGEPTDGGRVTFTAPASGASATLTGCPATVAAGLASVTATAKSTPGTFGVSATGEGANSVSFTLTAGTAAGITSPDAATFRVGTAGSFAVTATGFPAPAVSVSGTLPAGVAFDPASKTLSGTPTQSGVFVVTVRATNGVTPTASQTLTLTVNQAPAFTSAPSANFLLGTAGAFRVSTVGFPAATLSAVGSLPPGVRFTADGSGGGTLSGSPTRPGRYAVTLVARNGISPDATQSFTLVVPGVDQNAVPWYSTTGGAGGGEVRTPDGSVAATLPPNAGERAAVADVNGDGTPDAVVVSGPGGRVVVSVFDGRTGAVVATFPAFEDSFTGGAFVAAADITGDFRADIAVSADTTGSARVTVFDGALGDVIADFFGIDDPNFRGGARVSFGDLNADGTPDLIVAAGTGGGPRVAVYDGKTVPVRLGFVRPVRVVPDFFAFEQTLRNGVYVTAGDVTGDGFADLIFGGGPGGGPRVRVADGRALFLAGTVSNLDDPSAAALTIVNFFADTPLFTQGVRVAAKDLDGDPFADIVTGVPTDTGSTVRTYAGANLSTARPLPRTSVDLLPGDLTGVFVG